MSALARFGRNTSHRDFQSDGEHGSTGILSVISRLAADFRQNGLFSERQRIRAKNIGKPDWKRTVSRERAYALDGVGDVFPDIATTRTIDSGETLLAQIQAAVLTEIIEDHGWWIEGIRSRRADLRLQKYPSIKRTIWASQLDTLLPRLYSSRSIFLATFLAMYLRENRASNSGSLVFGIEDFHNLWEGMLRQILRGVEPKWNERLPRAKYIHQSGQSTDAPDRGMLTDIILRDKTGLAIVDAKYYSASSGGDVPGWPDIAKQMIYEQAVRSVEPTTNIRNYFVFPIEEGELGTFQHVKMHDRANQAVSGFPTIGCLYIPMKSALLAYLEGGPSIDLPAP
ncbi:LlaJI family restriction endonuclease [Marivivens sp. LCG002]|uniref:LlaJI family restriction endonuclease n=1 Tax=Marivivens sp. LCG002 TaxID=3051171 RepID=UPI0025567659|nr:LlaJI family restriction endonuclease [Marivivens sp. LCG002]WIV50279.1 LlaJI family restriction endonuclease [Marivivens sp. LCG002]